MAGVPTNFLPVVPNTVASYNYTDIASGTGVQIWYPCVANSVVGDQVLMDTPTITTSGSSRQTNAGTTALAFDSLGFNFPKVVKGNLWCSFGFGKQVATATGSIAFELNKLSGSTETPLHTSGSFAISAAATSGAALCTAAITTPTTIANGDKLRFRVWLTCGTGGGDWVAVGHQPLDGNTTDLNTTTSKTTIFKVGVPFRIEV